MFYYIPEWIKWWSKKPKPQPETKEDPLSAIIKKRAEEQNAIIDRPIEKVEVELLPCPKEEN